MADSLTITDNELEVFDDVAYAELPTSDPNVYHGQQFLNSVDSLQVGGGKGAKVMRADASGLWLGAETFADAPFSVDMDGNVVATSLSLSSLSGTLDDIANGIIYAKTTAAQVVGANSAATGLNTSGEIIKGFINAQLGSKALPTNGVRFDQDGLYGRHAGATTFYIDTAGNAYFVGDIVSSTMAASTITGGTIRTAASGARVEILGSSNDVSIYDGTRRRMQLYSQGTTFWDSSGAYVADIYAGVSGGLLITTANSGSTSRSIYIDAGAAGYASLGIGGDPYIYADGPGNRVIFNRNIEPGSAGLILGGGTYEFAAVYSTLIYFNTIGYVSSSGSAGTPFPSPTYWTPSRQATGVYRVTHPLGTANYVVIPTAFRASGSGAYSAKVLTRTSSYFEIGIFDDGGVSRDSDFMFILIPGGA